MVLLAAAMALAACNDISPVEPLGDMSSARSAHGPVVMTRNVYLGADLTPLLEAPSADQVPSIAGTVWSRIQATNFPARAGGLADEIVQTMPHVIGLQEAVLYQLQSPGDAVLGGQAPATMVAFDFVQLLLDSLAARGADYRVIAEGTGTVVELPVFTGVGPLPFDDVRFTDRDVILARGDVAAGNAQAAQFQAGIDLPIGGVGGPVLMQRRGWASVDATVDGVSFRFISTHLEIQAAAPVQAFQAAELLAIADASPLPVIMVGDFNSAADGSQTPTYGTILAAGFRDAWHRRGEAGYTCCHVEDLSNVQPTLDQRLDIIFMRGFGDAPGAAIGARTELVGDMTADRLPSGLWPSDHAGVVAWLRLPPPFIAVN